MSENRSRNELRVALSGLPPEALQALRPEPETQNAPLMYRGKPVPWRVIRGYLLAPFVGAAMGLVAMLLVGWVLPGFGEPMLDDQIRVLRMATAFGVILSLAPLLAAASMFALDHRGPYQVALAVALSWTVFGASGWLANAMSDWLGLVPPGWLIAAASL